MAEPSTTESQAPPQAGQARRRATRSPTVKLARLSALTGILFAALFVLALVFVYTTPHLSASDADITAFYSSSSTVLVTVGQTLVPLAGIAFLWHAHTTRLLIEFRTPSPSAIPYGLQLVSGILFVVLLFAGTASAGSVALLKDLTNAPLPSVDVARGLLALGYAMIFYLLHPRCWHVRADDHDLASPSRDHANVAGHCELPAGAFPAGEHDTAPGGRAHLPHLGRGREPGGLRPRRSYGPTGYIRKAIRMTTPQSVEDRTTPLTVDDIPGPKGKPVVGNMFDVPAERSIQTLMGLVREYGPMIRLRTPVGDRFIASGLPMIDDLCDDERFDELVGDGQKAVRAFGRSSGLFTSDTDDPNWSKAHNILLPNFSMQAMRDYVPAMNDIAAQLMQKWERLNPGELVDVTADTTRLTLDTIALCGFGYRFNSFYRDTQHPFVSAMVNMLQESQIRSRQLPMQARLRRGATRRLQESYRYMEDEVFKIIDERRRAGNVEDRRDLLSCMLTGVDKRSGEKLSDDNIVGQCITFLVAGHETTSGLLSFAISYLIKNPDVVASPGGS
jgi:hypothetical protein